MATKAGVITINLNAGTAKFMQDMDAAGAKVRQFGDHGVSSMVATSAAIRGLEGALPLRAVERFIATTLGMGPALQAAFPVVGAVIFGGVLAETGKKVYEFFRSIQDAPERIGGAFQGLTAPLRLTNDELQVSNDRLASEIAKLEGHHSNTLKLALDEARVSADKLAESLGKDLAGLNKLLKEEEFGLTKRIFGNMSTTDLREEIGGKTGYGGFTGEVSRQTEEGNAAIRRATDLKAKDAAQTALNTKLMAAYGEEISKLSQWLSNAEHNQATRVDEMKRGMPGFIGVDQTVRIEELQRTIQALRAQQSFIPLQAENEKLTERKGTLTAGKFDADTVKRLTEELNRAKEAQEGLVNVLEKINMEEQDEIRKLREVGEANAKNLGIVTQIYDTKRVTAYSEAMVKLGKESNEAAERWRKLASETTKLNETFGGEWVVKGTKLLKDHAKALEKLSQEYNKLTSAAANQDVQHKVTMIGLAPGAAADPLGTLAAQQAVRLAEFQERYENSLKAGTPELEKQNAKRELGIELTRLQNELEVKQAEIRQKGVTDFFLEMQGRAQSASNVIYEALHSALDKSSAELANLFTGQRTNFGKMFEDIGHQMLQSTIKSQLQTGLGSLGKMFGIDLGAKPDGSSSDRALWVRMAGGGAGSGGPAAAIPGGDHLNLGGTFGGGSQGGMIFSLLKSLKGGGIGSESSITDAADALGMTLPAMAGGGEVDPGTAYMVGERGPETFVPSSRGSIVPNGALSGGNQFHYHIDARGADLGAHNRIARGIEMSHKAAVTTAVQASAERAKRTPKKS